MQLPRRAGHDDHGRPVVHRHDQPGRSAGRVDRGGALGHHRLLAVRLAKRVEVEAEPPREAGRISADLRLHAGVEDQVASREPGHDLGREIVGGRAKAAAGDDQVHASSRQEAQRGLEVVRTVGDDQDVGNLHPEAPSSFESHGPLRSVIVPVITSVPVTTIPRGRSRGNTYCSGVAVTGSPGAGSAAGASAPPRIRGKSAIETST